jgi:hypothetical protein
LDQLSFAYHRLQSALCAKAAMKMQGFFFHISQLGQKHYGVALESLNDLQIWPPLETNFLAIWVWEIFGPANFHKESRTIDTQ